MFYIGIFVGTVFGIIISGLLNATRDKNESKPESY